MEVHSCLLTVMPKVSQIRGEMDICYFSADLQSLYVAAETFALLRSQHKYANNLLFGVSDTQAVCTAFSVNLLQFDLTQQQMGMCKKIVFISKKPFIFII